MKKIFGKIIFQIYLKKYNENTHRLTNLDLEVLPDKPGKPNKSVGWISILLPEVFIFFIYSIYIYTF